MDAYLPVNFEELPYQFQPRHKVLEENLAIQKVSLNLVCRNLRSSLQGVLELDNEIFTQETCAFLGVEAVALAFASKSLTSQELLTWFIPGSTGVKAGSAKLCMFKGR